jgi:hypothetical protein
MEEHMEAHMEGVSFHMDGVSFARPLVFWRNYQDQSQVDPLLPASAAAHGGWSGGILGGLTRSLLEALSLSSLNSFPAHSPASPPSTPAYTCTGPGGSVEAEVELCKKLVAQAALSLLLGPPVAALRPPPHSHADTGREGSEGSGSVPEVSRSGGAVVGLEGGEEVQGAEDVAGAVERGQGEGGKKAVVLTEVEKAVVLSVVYSQPHLLLWQVASFRSARLPVSVSLSLRVSESPSKCWHFSWPVSWRSSGAWGVAAPSCACPCLKKRLRLLS